VYSSSSPQAEAIVAPKAVEKAVFVDLPSPVEVRTESAPVEKAALEEKQYLSHAEESQRNAKMQGQRSRGPRAIPRNNRQPASSQPPPGFTRGQAAYHIPLTMVQDKASHVDLWIDASVTSDDLQAQLYRFLEESAKRAGKRMNKQEVKSKSAVQDEIVGKDVLIGKKMYAELIGSNSDFEISPSGSIEATYREGIPLRWSWLVKPKRVGKDGLPLEIRVMADPGEGRTPIEPIREVVVVYARERTWKEIFEELDWWIKLLTGGGISGALIWIYTKIRK
jgi:hypothetical protein